MIKIKLNLTTDMPDFLQLKDFLKLEYFFQMKNSVKSFYFSIKYSQENQNC